MTTVITLNIYHICVVACVFFLVALALFLLHNYGGVKLFIEKDVHIADKFFEKYPLVTAEFISKKTKEQIIENNQEIHEINKKLADIKLYMDRLNIAQSQTLAEVKKND